MTETRPGVPEERQLHKAINGEPVVVIDQLVKQFGKLRAVDNLSLSIDAGETFGLIGPNGSGKTTLIRMLVGLIRAASSRSSASRRCWSVWSLPTARMK